MSEHFCEVGDYRIYHWLALSTMGNPATLTSAVIPLTSFPAGDVTV